MVSLVVRVGVALMSPSLSAEEELLGGGAEQPEGRERMIITKCHSKIAVSSNARTMDQ